jgi:pilus assembly protein Flp/PilA
MNTLLAIIRGFIARREAATLIEYGLMLLLIAVVCIAAVAYIGSSLVLPMYQLPGM